jgi:hypothetical protein
MSILFGEGVRVCCERFGGVGGRFGPRVAREKDAAPPSPAVIVSVMPLAMPTQMMIHIKNERRIAIPPLF